MPGKPNGKGNKCKKCGSTKVCSIVYGLPTPEAEILALQGKLYLAGCLVPEKPHKWHCKECEYEWGAQRVAGDPIEEELE